MEFLYLLKKCNMIFGEKVEIMKDKSKEKLELIRNLEQRRAHEKTDKNETSSRLALQLEQFRALFTHTKDAYLLVDLKSVLLECNAATEEISGFARGELLGKNLVELDLIRGRDKVKAVATLAQSASGKTTEAQEYQLYRKDGQIGLVEVLTIPAQIDDKKYVLGIIRNISKQKSVEKVVLGSEEKYRAIFRHNPEVIVLIDTQGRLLEINERIKHWLGYESGEFVGKSILELPILTEAAKSLAMTKFAQRMKGIDDLEPYEMEFITKTGLHRTGRVHAEAFRDADGKIVGDLVIASDVTHEKQIERERRENHRFLRTLLSNIPGMVYRCADDKDWTMFYASEGSYPLTGYRPEELENNRRIAYAELIVPEDRDDVVRIVSEKLERKQSYELEYRITAADQKTKWVWERGVGVFDEQDQFLYLEGFITDITERKLIDKKLRESQERFESTFIGHPEAVAYLSPDFCIVDVNPRFEKLFGLRKSEIQGKNIDTLIVPEYKKTEADFLDKKSNQGYVSFDTLRKHSGGQLFPVSISAAPITVEGKISGSVAIYKDISEQAKDRQELRRAKQLFESMFMGNPEPSVYLDPNFEVININPRFEQVFGHTLEEIKGKTINSVLVREGFEEEAEMLNHMAEAGYVSFDTRRCRKDGTLIPVSISAAPMKVEDALVGYFAQYKDISEREKALEALRDSEEKHRLLVENVNDGIVISQNDKFIFINKQFAEMLGYGINELRMRDYHDVYTEKGLEILAGRKRGRERGEVVPSRYETFFKKKDESIINVEAGTTIIEYHGDTATFAVIRDITERKQAEETIRKSEIQYRMLFNQIADAIFVFDSKTQKFLDCNVAVNRIYGYTREELLQMTPFDLHPREEYQTVRASINASIYGTPQNYIHIKKTRERMNVEIHSDKITYRDRPAWISIVRDVTDRTRAAAERERIIEELQQALNRVKQLSGLVPICAGCKKIRDDSGYWNEVELYISKHSDAQFSHGLCPDCMRKYYPEYVGRLKKMEEKPNEKQ